MSQRYCLKAKILESDEHDYSIKKILNSKKFVPIKDIISLERIEVKLCGWIRKN